jgi:hypothetical protein
VGKIDNHAERLRAVDHLASPRRAGLSFNRSNCCGEWQTPGSDEGERCGGIRGVDATGHREM